jgi:putative addiction module CopG family antidote
MTVSIPPEFEQFVSAVIRQGEYQSEAEVVGAALHLLDQRDQLRQEIRAGMEAPAISAAEAFERLEQQALKLASGSHK